MTTMLCPHGYSSEILCPGCTPPPTPDLRPVCMECDERVDVVLRMETTTANLPCGCPGASLDFRHLAATAAPADRQRESVS